MSQYSRVRSFVRRQGRITPSQVRALETQWQQYGLDVSSGLSDWCKIFAREAACVLEIGFGDGESLLTQAINQPEKNFIGIEVHSPGVGRLLSKAAADDLKNLRVFREDAVTVIQTCIPDDSLDTVQIFFPDPWPKKRHHKRRIIQTEFINILVEKLKPHGCIHCATDWQNYAEHMMEVLTRVTSLKNEYGFKNYCPEAEEFRPVTKFERRGLKLGHDIFDLVFTKS